MGGRSGASREPKLWNAVFVAITGVSLCAFLVGQGINAGTSVYLARMGGSATLAGVGAAVFSAAALVARIVSGPLADVRGRLAVIVTGAVVLLVGVVGSAVEGGTDLFLLWRTVQGLGFSAITTAAATAAADALPAERLGEGIGYYGLGQAVATSIGPMLAIALASGDPAENLYWGAACVSIVMLALCAFCRYERHPERLPETATYRTGKADAAGPAGKGEETGKGLRARLFEPGALAGGVPLMVLAPAFGFGIFFAGLLGTELGVGNAGLFYTVSAVTMIVMRLGSRSFMDRVPAIKVFTGAAVAGIACFGMLFVASAFYLDDGVRAALFYAAGLPYGACLGVALPVNQAVAVKNSPVERWGAANGLFYLLYDVGIGVATLAWGVTNDLFGFPVTLACVMVLAAASVGVAQVMYPPEEKRWMR